MEVMEVFSRTFPYINFYIKKVYGNRAFASITSTRNIINLGIGRQRKSVRHRHNIGTGFVPITLDTVGV